MLPTQFRRTLRSTDQVDHHLRFELPCKSSSLCHCSPLSWSYHTSWLSLRQVSNPRGALQSPLCKLKEWLTRRAYERVVMASVVRVPGWVVPQPCGWLRWRSAPQSRSAVAELRASRSVLVWASKRNSPYRCKTTTSLCLDESD